MYLWSLCLCRITTDRICGNFSPLWPDGWPSTSPTDLAGKDVNINGPVMLKATEIPCLNRRLHFREVVQPCTHKFQC